VAFDVNPINALFHLDLYFIRTVKLFDFQFGIDARLKGESNANGSGTGTCITSGDGVMRARYRNSTEKTEVADPDEIYNLTLPAWCTSDILLKIHTLR
jgi:hypothetical protein